MHAARVEPSIRLTPSAIDSASALARSPTNLEAIRNAIADFHRALRDSPESLGWQDNKEHKYAIEEGARFLPVKQIVSLETGMPISELSGGEGTGQANQFIRDLGFEVVPLRVSRNPKWTRDELILALDFYLQHRLNPPGRESDEIAELSATLSQLAVLLGVPQDETDRNANGVYLKLLTPTQDLRRSASVRERHRGKSKACGDSEKRH